MRISRWRKYLKQLDNEIREYFKAGDYDAAGYLRQEKNRVMRKRAI